MPTFLDSSGIELKLAVIKYVVKFSFKWPTEKIYKNMEEDVKPLKNLKKEIFKLMNKIEEQS